MLDVQFLGVEELLAQCSSDQARISAGMGVAVPDATREGAAQARASAPRRTGTMINNPTDFVDVEICYNITATGIHDVKATSSISYPQPNPADQFAAVNYNLEGNYKNYSIALYNVLGNKVLDIAFKQSSGIILLPTSEIQSGVYFYSLLDGNKVISTNKRIVNHKN